MFYAITCGSAQVFCQLAKDYAKGSDAMEDQGSEAYERAVLLMEKYAKKYEKVKADLCRGYKVEYWDTTDIPKLVQGEKPLTTGVNDD